MSEYTINKYRTAVELYLSLIHICTRAEIARQIRLTAHHLAEIEEFVRAEAVVLCHSAPVGIYPVSYTHLIKYRYIRFK